MFRLTRPPEKNCRPRRVRSRGSWRKEPDGPEDRCWPGDDRGGGCDRRAQAVVAGAGRTARAGPGRGGALAPGTGRGSAASEVCRPARRGAGTQRSDATSITSLVDRWWPRTAGSTSWSALALAGPCGSQGHLRGAARTRLGQHAPAHVGHRQGRRARYLVSARNTRLTRSGARQASGSCRVVNTFRRPDTPTRPSLGIRRATRSQPGGGEVVAGCREALGRAIGNHGLAVGRAHGGVGEAGEVDEKPRHG